MSIANLSNPISQLNNDIYCNDLICTNLDASFSTLPVIETINLVAETIQIQPLPPINNTLNDLVALDPFGTLVIRQATSIPGTGDITGASSLGTGQPIYQSQSGFTLQFNSLTGTSGDIVISPPLAGNVNIDVGTNIANLTGTQTFTGTKSFTSVPNCLNGIQLGNLNTVDALSYAIPLGIALSDGISVVKMNNVVDTVSSQTLTNKTLTDPVINRIFNGQAIIVPTGISSIFALQSAGAQTSGNLCNYLNSSPTPAIIQDSGIAASSLVTLSGTQTLNNKTISNLTSTGTSMSLLSGKEVSYYWSATSTNSATAIIVLTIPISTNTAFLVESNGYGLCTASSGADVNKVKGFLQSSSCKNISGTVSTFTVQSVSGGDTAFFPTITHVGSGTNVLVQVTGIITDTINFSGTTTIYY
jgi:hypothetical protein